MTLVFRCAVDGCPFLLSDVLVTGEGRPGIDLEIPTLRWDSPVRPVDLVIDNRGPVGNSQKIACCGPEVIVGGAGDRDVLAGIVKELQTKRRRDGPWTPNSLADALSRFPSDVWRENQLLGWANFNGSVFAIQNGHSETLCTRLYGDIVAIGSGKEFLEKTLQDNERSGSIAPESIRDRGDVEAIVIALAASVMGEELKTGYAFTRQFGGAYDIFSAATNGFVSLDEVTYVYWQADVQLGKKPQLKLYTNPTQAIKVCRSGQWLIVRTFEYSPELNFVHSRVFPIPPAFEDPSGLEEPKAVPSLNSSRTCHCILVEGDVKGRWVCSSEFGPREGGSYVFEEKGGKIFRNVSPTLVSHLTQVIVKNLSREEFKSLTGIERDDPRLRL